MIEREAWPLVSAAQMRRLDLLTIEELDVSADVLMENAGRAAVRLLLEEFTRFLSPPGAEVLVACGSGNNGGDGFVVARHLQAIGIPVRVMCLDSSRKLMGAAGLNRERAVRAGVLLEGSEAKLPYRGVIVDALLGTGLERPLTGGTRQWVERITTARSDSLAVISVDLPSGLHADTGQPLGAAIQADATVTIGLPKRGLVLPPGQRHSGLIYVARVGIADALPAGDEVEAVDQVRIWTAIGAAKALPVRSDDGHKGSFGNVLVLAGSEGKTGAAALAVNAAIRTGAGLVTLGCPAGLNDILERKCTEAMTAPLPQTRERAFGLDALEPALDLAKDRDGVALGPGMGCEPETQSLIRTLTPQLPTPLVLDADGLNAFAGAPEALSKRRAPTVLTPHPGEAGRLLGIGADAVNADRVGSARILAARSECVTLLKGAGTVIAGPDGRVLINPTGCSNLATGGTGDVLAGIVVALLVQKVEPFDAAALAAYIHGLAAEILSHEQGQVGLLASELGPAIPRAIDAMRQDASRLENGVHQGNGILCRFPRA